MPRLYLLFLLCTLSNKLVAQEHLPPRMNKFADISFTLSGSQQSIALAYVHNWRVGKKRKIDVGLGVRNTFYFGVKKDFWTAPASLSRGSQAPFIGVFSSQKTENWDTLVVQRAFTNSTNLTANLGYHFSSKWYAGFNIDLIGFTFGQTSSGVFISNGNTSTEPSAKPAPFNLLLTGDLDLGTLNSEFFLKYQLTPQWAIKGIYQFLFVEYKTTTLEQIAPDGSTNDRFRNKANNFGLGIAYHFSSKK
jgi:hypothetical protein